MRAAFGIALLVALAFGPHAVLPSAPPAQDDYPLDVGMRWTYRAMGFAPGIRHVRRADGPWFEMYFDFKLRRKSILMRRTPEGVVTLRDGRQHLLMRFPMREGDGWRIDVFGEDLADCEVLTPQELDVLGKRTRCARLRVTHTERGTGKRWVDHEWYAPGLGLVKFTLFGLATYVLERFERGVK